MHSDGPSAGKYSLHRVQRPGHQPFTVSSERAYFIGFTDLVPDSIGQHLPGEMNGLWIPPLRIFRNITARVGGAPVHVEAFTVHPWKRIFEFGGNTLSLYMPRSSLMWIATSGREEIEVDFELAPLPVWLMKADTAFTVSLKGREALLNFSHLHRRYHMLSSVPLSYSSGHLVALCSGDSCISLHPSAGDSSDLNAHRIEAEESAYYSRMLSYTDFSSGNSRADSAFYWSKAVLLWLTHSQRGIGRGITAGHPEFPWYFGFDTMLMIDALLECNLWKVAEGSLELLCRVARMQKGRIPHEIITSGNVFNPGDVEESAMFPTALLKCYIWTGNKDFLLEHAQDAYASLCHVLDLDLRGPGAMEDEGRGSGIDIDTICFFIEGVEALGAMEVLVSEHDGKSFRRMQELRSCSDEMRKLLHAMWLPEMQTYANRLIDGVPHYLDHWTSIMPFYTGLADPSKYISFTGQGGGLGRITVDGGIRADRRGAVMPVQNGMMCLAAHRYGDRRNALVYLNYNLDAFGKFSPCCVPEITNSKDGCYMQAWSSAMVVHPLLRCFAGVLPAETGLRMYSPFQDEISEWIRVDRLHFRGRLHSMVVSAED